MKKTIVLFGALAVVAAVAAGQWERGVDAKALGSYYSGRETWYGINSPGLQVFHKRDSWPALHWAGAAQAYQYHAWYGSREELERFLAFGKVVPAPGVGKPVSVKAAARRWNHVHYEYVWDSGEADGRMLFMMSNLFPGFAAELNSKALILFHESGKGPPSHVAFMSDSGPVVKRTAEQSGGWIDCSGMREPWLLAWFADSEGMKDVVFGGMVPRNSRTGADCPWLIILQRKPDGAAVEAGESGLRLEWQAEAGTVAAFPLMGGVAVLPEQTREWDCGLPAELLARIRFWTSASRLLPVSCVEEFLFDEKKGAVTVRDIVQYREIRDEWGTQPTATAPLAPAVAMCRLFRDGMRLPLEFGGELRDTGFLSQWGPYYCAVGSNVVEYTVGGVGRLLDEELAARPADTALCRELAGLVAGHVKAALESREQLLHGLWSPSEGGYIYIGTRAEQAAALSRSLPFLPDELRPRAVAHIKALLAESVLAADCWEPLPAADSVCYAYDRKNTDYPPSWEDVGERALYALWAYAHYTGDWGLVAENWGLCARILNGLVWQQDYAAGMPHSAAVPWRLHVMMNGFVGLGRMARHQGDETVRRQAAYLLAKSMVAWAAQWKAPDYTPFRNPLAAEGHSFGGWISAYHGSDMPPLRAHSGTFLATRTQAWHEDNGFSWCTDPRLFSAPWGGVFLEAGPEVLRFFEDYFKDDVVAQHDLLMWLWPATFVNAHANLLGISQWGWASQFFRFEAHVKKTPLEQLMEWLPERHFAQEPFYLENLLAVLYAAGAMEWRKIQ